MTHPSPDELAAWARRAASTTDERQLVGHLLACETCRQRLRDLLVASSGEPPPPPRRPHVPEADEQEEAAALTAQILAQPPARREVLVKNSPRFHSLAVAERLIVAAAEARYGEAREMAPLGQLALAVLEKVDSAFYGERRVADLAGRAWTTVGRGRRIVNDLAGAECALAEAARHLAGTTDPVAEAAYLHSLAALRKDQRRFVEADELLARAAALYDAVGDDERAARVLTSLGSLHLDRGVPERAAEPLLEALRRVDPLGDPRTALAIRHNLALCLVETGHTAEAERLYHEARHLYARHADDSIRLRARWLEALLDAASGRDAEAERRLAEVEAAFAAADQRYDAAVVALDLAALYARQGRHAELKALARRLAPLFALRGIHREAVTALAFFIQAAERERASLAVVERVGGFLKRARLDPTLRFRTRGT
jgi:tetratricopeptide (TPR) repeat protein